MQLYEFEGKYLFQKLGIPIPNGDVAADVAEAKTIAHHIGYPVAIKGQILGGGRGKAGGIQFAECESELVDKTNGLFGKIISGERIEKILIEERVPPAREFYMGITLDPTASLPLVMISARGGVHIETVAEESPHTLHKIYLDPLRPVRLYHTMEQVSQTGLKGKALTQASVILLNLVRGYFQYQAFTAEINPLILTGDGTFYAADSKFEIDDSALFRLDAIKGFSRDFASGNPLEAEAQAAGVSYVRLGGGNIGLIAGGAGVGMATMDMISNHGGAPANFLDLGGDATPEKTAAALKIVLKTPGVEGVLLNAFGGINNCEEMAKGICRAVDELNPDPVITVKMRGHSQEEGWALLEKRQIPVVKYGTTEEAVELLLDEMRKKGKV